MTIIAKEEALPNIKRQDLLKFRNLADAFQALNHYNSQRFVYLGDCDDPAPYWIVTAATATKLEELGYERA